MKPRVCIVVASELTVRTLLRHHLAAMQGRYEVTVVANTTNQSLLEEMKLTANLVPVAIEREISIRKDILALVRLIRLFRQGQFNIVHSVTPKAGLLTMIAGLVARTPVRVHTFAGQVWSTRTGWSRTLLKTLDRLVASIATFTIVDGPAQRDFLLQERVVSASKSAVQGNGSFGVDGLIFHPDGDARDRIRGSLGIGSSEMVLLYIGRLTLEKGLLVLAQAFARVAEAREDVRLLIVGIDEENLRPAIRTAAGAHSKRLHFVGYTPESEAFMAAAEVLCLPSYREGFSNVIIEAAAVGVPSVASRIYGVVDAIEEGRTGFTHPPGDVIAMAETLLRVLADSDLRRRLGEAARVRALRDFSPATVTGTLMGLYERLLTRRISPSNASPNRQVCD